MGRLLSTIAVLMLALTGAAQAKRVTVKMATMAPKGSAFYRILMEMGQAWKDASDGQVRLKVFAGGVAGTDHDVIRKIRLGTINGGMLTVSGVATIDKAIHAMVIPMAYDSYAELDYVFKALQPDLEKIYAAKGFIVLNWVDAGFVRFFSREKLSTPEELSSRKLFVTNGHAEVTELWKAAGYNPVPLPSTEISTALQTGLIDVLPAPPQAVMLMQWNKTAKYMIDARWAPLVGATLIAKKTWERIDPELRPALLKAARAAGEKLRAESRPADRGSIEAMKKRGLHVTTVGPDTIGLWRARAEKAYPSIRGTFAPAEMFDRALKLRDQFRKLGSFTDGGDQ